MVRSLRSAPTSTRPGCSRAARLMLPIPPLDLVTQLIDLAIEANGAVTPPAPGSLYLRPTLLGTDVTIGAAAYPSHSAVLYVLACPVGDYLARGRRRSWSRPRCSTTPQFGVVKTGANYAMALGRIDLARREHHADQVLLRPAVSCRRRVRPTWCSSTATTWSPRTHRRSCTASPATAAAGGPLLGWTVEERTVTVDEVAAWAACPGGDRPHGQPR
ncbi:MAG: hypothetical protein R2713_00230 [Ilumatobacteraceae bacterium]